MAEGTSSGEIHNDTSRIVTISKKTISVWNYFGFRKRDKNNKAALCKLCEKFVVHAWQYYQSEKPLVYMAQEGVDELFSQTASTTLNQLHEDSYIVQLPTWQSSLLALTVLRP